MDRGLISRRTFDRSLLRPRSCKFNKTLAYKPSMRTDRGLTTRRTFDSALFLAPSRNFQQDACCCFLLQYSEAEYDIRRGMCLYYKPKVVIAPTRTLQNCCGNETGLIFFCTPGNFRGFDFTLPEGSVYIQVLLLIQVYACF